MPITRREAIRATIGAAAAAVGGVLPLGLLKGSELRPGTLAWSHLPGPRTIGIGAETIRHRGESWVKITATVEDWPNRDPLILFCKLDCRIVRPAASACHVNVTLGEPLSKLP